MSEIEKVNENPVTTDSRLVINLSKEYKFEGTTYKKIDLNGLNELTAGDMIAVNRTLSSESEYLQEMTMEFACAISARAAQQPVEFFTGLPMRDAIRVKRCVTNFLYSRG